MNRKKILGDVIVLLAFVAVIFAIMVCAGLVSGCASVPSTVAAPTVKYELLLSGSIDGNAFQGVGVGSTAVSHAMSIRSPVGVNYFTVESCHRSQQFNDIISEPWYTWITGSQTLGFDWSYTEAPTIEDTGDCPLRFCAFSNTPGSPPVACAVVDFKSSKYALPSENICNGADGGPNSSTGTSLCHTQVGLIERMRFSGPVDIAPEVTDPTGKNAPYWIQGQCQGSFVDSSNTLWQYIVPSSECTAIFMEVAKPHRRAKLTVIPYTQALYGGS